ncbi:MAG TPA: GNAT family N-acetyltransferase, partial [Oligoflexia bacterium]|nr:GNAT family N-acetyltransferase [Oligoflexia bacterium]
DFSFHPRDATNLRDSTIFRRNSACGRLIRLFEASSRATLDASQLSPYNCITMAHETANIAVLRLVQPSIEYEASYRSFLAEFQQRQEKLIPFPLLFPADDFRALIKRLRDAQTGLGVPQGFVAHSTFWLINENCSMLGMSNLRHELTPQLAREGGHIGYSIRPSQRKRGYGKELLRLTLEQALLRGIKRILITCAKTNTGSVGVILANGGCFDSEEYISKRGEIVQRYWIVLGA